MFSPKVILAAMATTAALGMTACSPSDVAPAQTTSSSPITPAGVQFPDMSGYTEGDPNVYFSGGQRFYGLAFRTEDGQKCVSNSYRSPEDTLLRCWGPRPDKGSGTWEVTTRSGSATTIRRLPDTTTPAAPADPTPVLPAGHVLTYPDAHLVCGVTDDGMTACKVDDHGFVLAPTTTVLF